MINLSAWSKTRSLVRILHFELDMSNKQPFKSASALAVTSTAHRSSGTTFLPVRNSTEFPGHSYPNTCSHPCSHTCTLGSIRNLSSRKGLKSPMKRFTSCMQRVSLTLFTVVVFAATSVFVTAHYSYGPTNTPSPLRTDILSSREEYEHSKEQNVAPPAIRNRLDWNEETPERFCSEIKDYPQPLRKNCSTAKPVPGAPICDPKHPMMFSQYGEDYFLYTRHFQYMERPGTYLDIATNK